MTTQLRDDLDAFAETYGYSGRSEIIREACQSLLEEYQQTESDHRRVVGTITAVFEYDTPRIEREMRAVRHEFEAAIRSNSHTCLDDNAGCTETFVLEADSAVVFEFIATVRGVDETITVEYTTVPVDGLQTDPEPPADPQQE